MRFLQIDPSDPNREFSIVIDASERTYKGMKQLLELGSYY